MIQKNTQIAIIGAGPIGAVSALTLAQAGTPVVLIDKGGPLNKVVTDFDRRAYALSLSSIQYLKSLGIWDQVSQFAQPIEKIWVVEEGSKTPLTFDHAELGKDPLGAIVESQHLLRTLHNQLAETKNIEWLQHTSVQDVTQDELFATVTGEEVEVKASLVICADGRFSKLREKTQLKTRAWSYGQTAIVCPLIHEKPHNGWAFELFTPHGPFAILPMQDTSQGQHTSSLVWSVPPAYAEMLLSLDEKTFSQTLQDKFGEGLGHLQLNGKRWSYPLSGVLMEKFFEGRMVFAGDATCGIHPVAGQGLNLGLQGVGSLCQSLIGALDVGMDPGRPEILEQYHVQHRPRVLAMSGGTHGIVKIFESPLNYIRESAGLGLGVVQKIPPLKRLFMRVAMGLQGSRPSVMGQLPPR